jgi:hypothetical protein
VLLDQPCQDPAGSMALLPRRRRVLGQHGLDRRLERIQPGDDLTGVFRAGGTGSANACRTVSRPI